MMENFLIKLSQQLESVNFACSGDELDQATRTISATLGSRHWTACKIADLRLQCLGPALVQGARKSDRGLLLSHFASIWQHSVRLQLTPPACCSDAILLCSLSFLKQNNAGHKLPAACLARVSACLALHGIGLATCANAQWLLEAHRVPMSGASGSRYLKASGDAARDGSRYGEALLLYRAALMLLVDLPLADEAGQLHHGIRATQALLSAQSR